MSPTILTAPRRAAIKKICVNNQVSYLALFGSHSRGDNNPTSDVDLLVDFSDKKSLFDLVRLQSELEQTFEKKVDLVPRRNLKPALKIYISTDLSPIYDEIDEEILWETIRKDLPVLKQQTKTVLAMTV